MKKIFFILLVFISSLSYSQYNWNGTKLLTQGYVDKNPAFGMKNTASNPYLPFEFMVFERNYPANYSNICAIKMGYNGSYESVFYVTSGNNLCRNASIDYFKYFSNTPMNSLVVWEQFVNGRWNLYGRAHNSSTGWGNIFPVDTTSLNKYNPSVGRLYSEYLFGVAYKRNNDIIYKELNISTGTVTLDSNLTINDTAICRKPTLSVNNFMGYFDKYVAFEKQKPNGQFAIYKRSATNLNVWSAIDTVSTIGNNRNPKFICGYLGTAYLTFESNRNGKWNIYNSYVYLSTVYSIENIYNTTTYNCRGISSFFYPIVTDFTSMLVSFVREGSDTVKILSGSAYGSTLYFDSIAVGDTSKKPVTAIGKGIGSGRGYSTIWMVYNKDSAGYSKLYGKYMVRILDDINKINGSVPDKYSLSQNYPNPFNPLTIIRYSLPVSDFVKLKVYDVKGVLAATLVSEKQSTGNYEVTFNGSVFSSGVYFYKIETSNYTEIKRMILVK